MKLWIVETTVGTRLVVYAENVPAAVAAVRETDRPLVCGVREWPSDAPFRVAFVPATPADEDGAVRAYFWDGLSDWGEHMPPATEAALGNPLQAAADRDKEAVRLKDEHDAGGHEPGVLEDCPTCLDEILQEATERRATVRSRSRFDA